MEFMCGEWRWPLMELNHLDTLILEVWCNGINIMANLIFARIFPPLCVFGSWPMRATCWWCNVMAMIRKDVDVDGNADFQQMFLLKHSLSLRPAHDESMKCVRMPNFKPMSSPKHNENRFCFPALLMHHFHTLCSSTSFSASSLSAFRSLSQFLRVLKFLSFVTEKMNLSFSLPFIPFGTFFPLISKTQVNVDVKTRETRMNGKVPSAKHHVLEISDVRFSGDVFFSVCAFAFSRDVSCLR